MKSIINIIKSRILIGATLAASCILFANTGYSQTDTSVKEELVAPVKTKVKPVKNTFNSTWVIDNQTVLVPVKGSIEMDIQHRFGSISSGYEDFWGLFAPSNMRLGIAYSPIKNLRIGGGIVKIDKIWDITAKYSLITQTPGKYPVSVTFYSNMGFDTRKNVDSSLFKFNSQRYSFFNQIIIARKITERLSLQVAPSISHQNFVNGFYTKNDSSGKETFSEMKHDHIAVAVSGRYKYSSAGSFLFDYNQPITKHNINNPAPSASFGVEFHTSGHSFQLFFTNYFALSPQHNNLYNTNSPFNYTKNDVGDKVQGGRYLLGFNITRLW